MYKMESDFSASAGAEEVHLQWQRRLDEGSDGSRLLGDMRAFAELGTTSMSPEDEESESVCNSSSFTSLWLHANS
jgi:hypothetical protein